MSQTAFNPAEPAAVARLRILAEQAARIGGGVARDHFHSEYTIRRKADGSEVSDVDEAAQAAIVRYLRTHRPQDAFITEEHQPPHSSTPAPAEDVVCWVIDPLDGTRNYVRRVPLYVTSIAALYRGVPVVGAIYAPERDELFSTGEAGVTVNGRPAPVARDMPPTHYGRPPRPLVGIPSTFHGAAYQVMQSWVARVVVRNLGATALHLAMVAAGQFHAALISDSRLWDIAAGWLLVKAAGGVMTTLEGREIFPLDVASYGGEALPSLACIDRAIHEQLLPPGLPPF